ncbi:coiled-coil domain-containing protein 93 [Culicoides brevitarsis]|uniref:coiled-coil domain-containing protein 93 n=1 Tax=Culicoides brevitarsis TaxID=469753 RepID=UPI00307B7107
MDVEQSNKQVEILDVLVASGYFRARLKSYGDFDKIVGGMVFCLEGLDNIDLDVDFLFHDSLSIGQKIALTEKIVAVLPQIGCPYTLEPHQIQGLDFINIFPVIQWLVKRSIESRAEKADRLNAFAVNQFHNDFSLPSSREKFAQRKNMVENLKTIQEQLKPRRKFRKTGNIDENDEKLQVQTTLLEYASQLTPTKKQTLIEKFAIQDDVDFLDQLEAQMDDNLTRDHQEVISEYKNLKLEFGENDENLKMARKINELKETKVNLERQLALLKENFSQATQKQRDEEQKLETLKNEKNQLSTNLQRLKEKHATADAEVLAKLTNLLQKNEEAKQKEIAFKNECKKNLAEMEQKTKEYIDILEDENSVAENMALLETEKQNLAKTRVKVSKKTRQVIVLNRALDVPSRSELAQYQRRFLELYTQVSAKHKETKQFYTLYNTLNDTKQYIEKEKTLLNSIYENFSSSMNNPSIRDQFLKQFESIVMGVKENKNRVQKRLDNEKAKKQELCAELVALLELQRKYVAATKKLQQLVG